MERIAVTAHLRPGTAGRVGDLVAQGPPFDPSQIGLSRHTVFAREDLVVFVFEGEGVAGKVRALINDPVRSAAFGAWGPILAEPPKLAHVLYDWSKEEST